jgi:hypothetical protein
MQNLIDQISSAYEIFTDAKNLLLAYPFKLDLFMVSSHSTTFLYENTRVSFLKSIFKIGCFRTDGWIGLSKRSRNFRMASTRSKMIDVVLQTNLSFIVWTRRLRRLL